MEFSRNVASSTTYLLKNAFCMCFYYLFNFLAMYQTNMTNMIQVMFRSLLMKATTISLLLYYRIIARRSRAIILLSARRADKIFYTARESWEKL